MKNPNLKMLALLGITGGLIVSGTEAEAAGSNYDYQNSYAGRHGCGGNNGCGGRHGCGGSNGCGGSSKPEKYDDDNDDEDIEDSNAKENESAYYNSNGEINEHGFYTQLDAEGRRIFDGLSLEGRQLALRLSKQYSNKNQAVRAAQRQLQHSNGETGNTRSVGVKTRRSLFR